QPFQEVCVGVETVHDFVQVVVARQKITLAPERAVDHRLISPQKVSPASNFEKFIPGGGGFQLIASGSGRPVGLVGQDPLVRQGQNGGDCVAAGEVGQQGAARLDGGVPKLGLQRDAPRSQQAADNDAGIKEVGECGR